MEDSVIISNNKKLLCAEDTNIINEPNFKKARCAYCGDAPVPHVLFYVLNLIGGFIDNHIKKVAGLAPQWLERLADLLPRILFKTFVFLKMARYSSDVTGAKTFRSRVIWEEAERRGIKMEQLVLWGKNLEYYRAILPSGREIYFESIPIPEKYLNLTKDWDDKKVLKVEFEKHKIPVPRFREFSYLKLSNARKIFEQLQKPLIVKPKIGSRGRHTSTNISTLEQFKDALSIGSKISPTLLVEEHLHGPICRATVVQGRLMGFYRGEPPEVVGDGRRTVRELIDEVNKLRPERVSAITISRELKENIQRAGITLDEVLPEGERLKLLHRAGRLWGGRTREMLSELHPSFIPIFERAGKATGLFVAGFDAIIPDPTLSAEEQKWGIIECNTLPFIDLHYYALFGTPQNIAGAIWDYWI